MSRIVATFPYTLADGVVRYRKVKYQPKSFSIERPNGKGWEPGMGDQQPLLYRLQNLVTAPPGEPCYVNEGEKACDRLAKLNQLSTCVAASWDGVDLEPLRGRDCFIIRDDDQGGEDKNADLKAFAAAKALHGVAKSVRIWTCPTQPPGGDVVDWLDRNDDDVTTLWALCEAAPEYQPQMIQAADAATLIFERMADVEPKQVEWLWPGRIARGKQTLLAGDPGIGKSQIAIDITSHISTGEGWPDGSSAPRGSVIIFSAEDSANDIIRPRLEAAGADLTRVHALKAAVVQGHLSTFSLQHDLIALGAKVKEIGDVSLVVIDPITSYLGRIDSHRTTDVRNALGPLAKFAEENNIAVLTITHPPKASQSKAIHAFTGSLAFVADARLVFIAIEGPQTERRLLLAVKNNLGAKAQGLGFHLAQRIVGSNIVASHVVWDTAPVTMTADEAIRAAASSEGRQALIEAMDFLRDELVDGARPSQHIEKAAKNAGLSMATVRRAKRRLKIKSAKIGLEGGWEWQLPEHAHLRPEDTEH